MLFVHGYSEGNVLPGIDTVVKLESLMVDQIITHGFKENIM
jgi:hypothetical protein